MSVNISVRTGVDKSRLKEAIRTTELEAKDFRPQDQDLEEA